MDSGHGGTDSMRGLGPLGWLIAAVSALSIFRVTYAALGMMPSAASDLLTSYGLSLALILWFVDDASARRCVPCFDFGFLWPSSAPRRWTGMCSGPVAGGRC